MARGHQKIQSQQKAQEKAAKMKKQQGHGLSDQMKAAQKALVFSCAVCKELSQPVNLSTSLIHPKRSMEGVWRVTD
nr:zinc finger protein 706-like isoform X1 [Aedes albopictus]